MDLDIIIMLPNVYLIEVNVYSHIKEVLSHG
jgi:hypothetical protein